MQPAVIARLTKLLEEGSGFDSEVWAERWASSVEAFLRAAGAPDECDTFSSLTSDDTWYLHAIRIGHLQGLIAKAEAEAEATKPATVATSGSPNVVFTSSPNSRKVFVVHGHDNDAKEGTARFLERLGLQPIILHEQPSSGRTIIEKVEIYSGDIAFAVVLLSRP